MPLESVTYISDLVATNPVNATDQVAQGDDHIRAIKTGLLNTFPNVTGAVTLTHSQINEAARLSAPNEFTSGTQTISAANPYLRLNTTSAGSDAKLWAFSVSTAGTLQILTRTDVDGGGETLLEATRTGTGITALALAADSITLNGVGITDFARIGVANTFLLSQKLSAADEVYLRLDDSTAGASLRQFGVATADGSFVIASLADDNSYGATALQITKNSSQVITSATLSAAAITLAGATTAATITNSDSETLVAGQLHFIDGNATLPNLTAGQWVQVINDSASPITISKNGSDTTYWATTGATVSTSFTLAARGVLTARCNPAGSSVYVTGAGITAAS